MRMTDAIRPGSPTRATQEAVLPIAFSSLPRPLAAGQTNQHEKEHSLLH